MKPVHTAILFLVAAVLGAFVYFYEIRGEEARQEAEERAQRLFPGVEPEDVEWIALTTDDGTPVRVERRAEGWEGVEPLRFRADAFALDGVASSLVQLTSEAVYEEPQAREVYGLGEAEGGLRFGAGGEERGLRVGNKTPMGSNSYVAVAGSDAVYTVPTWKVQALSKSFDDLRDRRILSFDTTAVRSIAASWPGGRVALQRGDDGWALTQPLQGRADSKAVDDLLSNLSFLRADGFEDDPPPDAETGLDAPDFTVELELAPAGEEAEPRRLGLAVGASRGESTRLVRAAGSSLYRIAAERIDDFPRSVVEYRFRTLSEYPVVDAERVEFVFQPAPGEEREVVRITANREQDGWSASPEPMAPDKVATLVRELANLRARDILADRVGPQERAELQLDPPNVGIWVYGAAGEEGAGEPLAEVRLGVFRGEAGIVAQSAEDPVVYQLDYELAEHLPVTLDAFRNRFLVEEPEATAPPAEE